MSVRCPNCGFAMELKGARPGRFQPKCTHCGDKFILVVSEDPNIPPFAQKLPSSETVSNDVARGLGMETPQNNRKPAPPPSSVQTMAPRSAPSQTAPPPSSVRNSQPAPPGLPSGGAATMPPPQTVARSAISPESSQNTAPPRGLLDSGADASNTAPPPYKSRSSDSLAHAIYRAEQAMKDEEDPPPAPPSHEAARSVPRPNPAQRPSAMQTAAPQPVDTRVSSAILDDSMDRVMEGDAPPVLDAALREIERAEKLGGYEIIKKLGQGGMGAVYLARQVSLDRQVAVKILAPQLARDPSFVARFTREAYAAAQLTHHNIVQIHDIGEEHDVHYFSMEFVVGETLGDVVRKAVRLDPEAAVGFVLQAARGLKFAHEHSMIHRDIKPDNLLLNEQGLVKVADLGLVKRRGYGETTLPPGLAAASQASVTGAALSMGTPAYMAPEQARDAAKVDERADIYSLGCTLYDLVTGRPPFIGKTAVEVITKHSTEAVPPPEKFVKNVPRTLSAILMKMMAKRAQDRYSNMDEVIHVLEEYLGVSTGGSGPFTPKEEHATALENNVSEFNRAGMAMSRKYLIAAFYLACTIATIISLWFASKGDDPRNYILAAGAAFGMGLLTFISYLVITGITGRTILFRKLRQYILGARWGDWIRASLGFLVLVGVLIVFGLQWIWLGLALAAVLLALAFHAVVDLSVSHQRKPFVQQVEEMLRGMRQRGLDEDALRQFVCKYSGQKWEEFYENLFGYEEKLVARRRWGVGARGRGRPRFAAWRDPIIDWIDLRLRQRKEDRELALFTKIEEKKLKAEGVQQAKAKARKTANNVVAKAERMRESVEQMASAPTILPGNTPSIVAKRVSLMDDQPIDDEHVRRRHDSYLDRKYGSIWGLLLGSQVRLLVGLGLLVIFLLGKYQVHAKDLEKAAQSLKEKAAAQLVAPDKSQSSNPQSDQPQASNTDTTTSDNTSNYTEADRKILSFIPRSIRNTVTPLFQSNEGGLAGLILIISALFRGAKMGLFMAAALAVMLLGGPGKMFSVPTLGLVRPENAGLFCGCIIAVCGYFFGRE